MKNDTAILVISFDGYADVWSVFFNCKDNFWKSCPYKTYLVSNNKDCDANCTVIKTGNETNWCDRVIKALDSVEENNLILLLEDYLIGNEINNKEFSKYISFYLKKKAKYLRLIDIPHKHKSKLYGEIYPIMSNEEYGINLQPAIWNKNFLLSILNNTQGGRSAWDFEVTLLRVCTSTARPVEGCFGSKKNVLNVHNGILKGKWFKNEIYYFRRKGFVIELGARGVLSKKEYYNHLIRRSIREFLSPSLRKKLKRILIKLNFKFVSNE